MRPPTRPPVTDSAHPDRPPLLPHQVEHDRLDRLVAGAEHQVAEFGPQPFLPRVEDPGGLDRVGALGSETDLQPVPAAGEERERRIARLVEFGDHVVEPLVQTALALAPGEQHPTGDREPLPRTSLQLGDDAPVEHVVHLVRYAGHGEHHLLHAVDRHGADETGRGAARLRDDRGAGRHHRLAQIVLGHSAASAGEHVADDVAERLVEFEVDAHHPGDRLTGQVVVGGSETAAHDDGVGLGQAPFELEHDPVDVVADLDLHERVDPVGGEFPADPRRVRVDDLAEQQLGPHGHHVTTHAPVLPHG